LPALRQSRPTSEIESLFNRNPVRRASCSANSRHELQALSSRLLRISSASLKQDDNSETTRDRNGN
jgi:hypothetical protein